MIMICDNKENRVKHFVEEICKALNERREANIILADLLKQAESEGFDKKALHQVAKEQFKISQDDELQAELNQQRNLEEIYRQALEE